MSQSDSNELPVGFTPSEYDCICGWARQNYHHAGNRRLRETITENVDKYAAAKTKTEKGQVIIEIVDKVRRESPSGVGFVKLNSKTGRWSYIGTEKAKDKVGHALRKCSQEDAKKPSRPSDESISGSAGGRKRKDPPDIGGNPQRASMPPQPPPGMPPMMMHPSLLPPHMHHYGHFPVDHTAAAAAPGHVYPGMPPGPHMYQPSQNPYDPSGGAASSQSQSDSDMPQGRNQAASAAGANQYGPPPNHSNWDPSQNSNDPYAFVRPDMSLPLTHSPLPYSYGSRAAFPLTPPGVMGNFDFEPQSVNTRTSPSVFNPSSGPFPLTSPVNSGRQDRKPSAQGSQSQSGREDSSSTQSFRKPPPTDGQAQSKQGSRGDQGGPQSEPGDLQQSQSDDQQSLIPPPGQYPPSSNQQQSTSSPYLLPTSFPSRPRGRNDSSSYLDPPSRLQLSPRRRPLANSSMPMQMPFMYPPHHYGQPPSGPHYPPPFHVSAPPHHYGQPPYLGRENDPNGQQLASENARGNANESGRTDTSKNSVSNNDTGRNTNEGAGDGHEKRKLQKSPRSG